MSMQYIGNQNRIRRWQMYNTGGGELSFQQKVLSLFSGSFVGYWPMDETSGTTALDASPQGNNGTYVGVDLNNKTLPPSFGGGAPYFDAVNDYLTVLSAGFNSRFNGQSGSLIGVAFDDGWADSNIRYFARIVVDGSNSLVIRRNGANLIEAIYTAGGTAKTVTQTSFSPPSWFIYGARWDLSGDKFAFYLNSGISGSEQTGLGTWAGALTVATIGAGNTIPTTVYKGWIGHNIVINRPFTGTEWTSLYGASGV